ncbi:MAG: GntR family transcriptional regulator [Kiritimatiellae bacterium]|nr:GntR family transcriptional regulator [Kiritimatiellia bacterium]
MNMPRSTSARVPPFIIDRKSTKNFPDQMTDGLRQAIVSGYYRPGERLPTIREFSKLLHVSIRAPLEAIDRLREENLVSSHPRHGITVVAKGDRVYKGHILFVSPDGDESFYVNVLAGSLRDSLAPQGYLYTRVAVLRGANGKYDFKMLDLALRQSIDLVVLMFDRPDIVRHLASKGVPFALIAQRPHDVANCVGRIAFDRNAAVSDFALRCRAAGVRSVLQVCSESKETDAISALAKAGIKAEELVVPYPLVPGNITEGAARGALQAFEKKLAKGKDWLPDLLFFADDVQASGALMALQHHGVRIPEDVKVVTWANHGLGPVFWKSLARMEMDPYAHGATIAQYVLSFLRGHGLPDDAAIGPRYLDGDTFPA